MEELLSSVTQRTAMDSAVKYHGNVSSSLSLVVTLNCSSPINPLTRGSTNAILSLFFPPSFYLIHNLPMILISLFIRNLFRLLPLIFFFHIHLYIYIYFLLCRTISHSNCPMILLEEEEEEKRKVKKRI